ncbi:MAG: hypothetical protein JAZ13_07315 [Candidatus Thiodiazotropha taylori]|nr:hypothetical protein [Candidatus Thiodiazotropha taylori]
MNDDQLIMTFVSTVLALIIGGVITWITAKHYYEKASKELSNEAMDLKKNSILLLRGYESLGLVRFSRDEEGRYKGLVHEGKGGLQAQSASINGKDTD